jgi:monothiol glutaredoxin
MSDNPFNIIGGEKPNLGTSVDNVPGADVTEKIKNLIASSDLFVFMKGTPQSPMCGFSANTVAILNQYGVEFNTFDILTDMDIRQGVKDYSNWPTYPQVYWKGKLLGGNDILTEMHQDEELEAVFKN